MCDKVTGNYKLYEKDKNQFNPFWRLSFSHLKDSIELLDIRVSKTFIVIYSYNFYLKKAQTVN